MKKTVNKQKQSNLIGTAVVIRSKEWLKFAKILGFKTKFGGEIGLNAFLGTPSAATLKRAGYDPTKVKLVPVDLKTATVLKTRFKLNKSLGFPQYHNAAPIEAFNTTDMIQFASDRDIESGLFD